MPTYHVDPVNGSDSNDGTKERPFKTFKPAVLGISGSLFVGQEYDKPSTHVDNMPHFTCETCGCRVPYLIGDDPPDVLKCEDCREVEMRLDDYLRSGSRARDFVIETLAKVDEELKV
jgi:hypothetical protein